MNFSFRPIVAIFRVLGGLALPAAITSLGAPPAKSPGYEGTGSKAHTTPGDFGDARVPDGIFRHLGTTYFIKNGRAERVRQEMKLSEGITIQPNGKVTLRDGKTVRLSQDQMMTLSGEVKTVSPSLTLPAGE